MAKSKEQLRKAAKDRRTRNKEANKKLKSNKQWYPVSDTKKNFERTTKKVRPSKLRKDITPGQVLIILSGRFRGRRVVFLKQLPSGLLLVTGPYKFNGVPLKRVNQAYVIPTKTKVNLGSLPGADKLNDEFFTTRVAVKRGTKSEEFFEDPKKKKERVTEARRNNQNAIDTEVVKAVKSVPHLKEYLQNRFALKNGDKPHLMQF
jgi:large subunit ribosomal protein L6e